VFDKGVEGRKYLHVRPRSRRIQLDSECVKHSEMNLGVIVQQEYPTLVVASFERHGVLL
jgi:hypothetical protein